MHERSFGFAGLALVVLASATAAALRPMPAAHRTAVTDVAASHQHAVARIPDAEAVVGRPHDGPSIERALRTWSRHQAQHRARRV